MSGTPDTGLQLRSLVTEDGRLELSLVSVPVPAPGVDEVLVRVEAAPINPSDLGLLLAGADVGTAVVSGSEDRPVLTAEIAAGVMKTLGGGGGGGRGARPGGGGGGGGRAGGGGAAPPRVAAGGQRGCRAGGRRR